MRLTCTKRHKIPNFIRAPTTGREMTSVVWCGAAGVRQQLRRPPTRGTPSAGAARHLRVFVANAIWFGGLCACFYSLDPQLGCHCKSWLRLLHQPSLKGFKSQAQSREQGLVPAGPGAVHVGPASAIWPCAFAVNLGLFLLLIFPFLPLLEQFKWRCG